MARAELDHVHRLSDCSGQPVHYVLLLPYSNWLRSSAMGLIFHYDLKDLYVNALLQVFLSFALGIFLYQTLDNTDGKQAVRTNSCSALGELFDHGSDSLFPTVRKIFKT